MDGTRPCSERAAGASRARLATAITTACVLAAVAAAGTLAVAVALGGCGGDEPTGATVYTEADDGTTVRAEVGDEFTIRLVENPSTGYTWTLSQSRGLKLLRDELEQPSATPAPDGPAPALVGAPGTRVFAFEVTGTGTQLIQAVYHRTWEAKEDAGAQEFTLTVEVR